jgi:hypothetical protein
MLQMLKALCERMGVAAPARDKSRYGAFVSASTAYAVAASFMKRPASDAGSRFLFSDVANHAPVAGS